MARKNIQVTQSFVEITQKIAIQSKKLGSKYQKISNELSDFVYSELETYDVDFYELLKTERFEYNRNGFWLGWRGGGEKTIERLIKESYCSRELFNVIGYFFFKDEWTENKQKEFTICSINTYCQKFRENLLFEDALFVLLICNKRKIN